MEELRKELILSALQSELEAVKLYLLALGKVKKPDVRNLLGNIAKTEEDHFLKIYHLLSRLHRPFEDKFDPKKTLEEAKKSVSIYNISEKLKKSGITHDSSIEYILRFAIDEEVAAQKFYNKWLEKLEEDEVTTLMLNMLIREEKDHELNLKEILKD